MARESSIPNASRPSIFSVILYTIHHILTLRTILGKYNNLQHYHTLWARTAQSV
jgi:hypothetical protein